tara:strand:+ start:364 stop:2508 length:2145 start_codon:yes stop_codon:yes gene_type:complete
VIGLSLGVERQQYFGFPNFSSLFAAGETGVIFDPSTTGTLYQTTAMIIPANPGDTVGMMLDQSQWGGAALGSLYGAELVTNGTFETDVSGWAISSGSTISFSSGAIEVNFGSSTAYATQSFPTEIGAVYRISGEILQVGGVFCGIRKADDATATINIVTLASTLGSHEGTFTATATTTFVILQVNADPTGIFDNISVKKVTVANALAPIVGPELVTNGTFETDTVWTKGAGWTISGGSAIFGGTGSASGLNQAIGLAAGRAYEISGTITSYTTGAVTIRLTGGSTVTGPAFFAAGGFRCVLIAVAGNVDIQLFGSATAVLSVDNITVKEIPGYHATQATASKRPIYGIHPFGGRRNLLTYSEAFNDAVWTKLNATINAFGEFTDDATSGQHYIRYDVTKAAAATQYTLFFDVKAGSRNFCYLQAQEGGNFCRQYFNVLTGTVGTGASSGLTLNSASVDAIGAGVFRCKMTFTTGTATTLLNYCMSANADNSASYAGAGDIALTISKSQLETAATATAYQKVVSQYEVTETGVPSVHYLAFDGVDDAMATPSIDFTATDEMSVFAGVRKLSDAAGGVLCELSASSGLNDGTIGLLAPRNAASATYGYNSKGTLAAAFFDTAASYSSPITNILTAQSKIATDTATLGVNGASDGSSAADQGTGNMGNFPLYIGARNLLSLYLNGHLYGLTMRGALTEPPTLSRAESLMANKTGIEL